MKHEKIFQKILLAIIISIIPLLSFYIYNTYYPFSISEISSVVPTNKAIYHPGDRVAFKLEICVDKYKYDLVTFQLESDPNSGNYYFQTLGSFRSLSIPGCWKISDINSRIPSDLFTSNDVAMPGKHRLFVIVGSAQNHNKAPKFFQSDWFEIQ